MLKRMILAGLAVAVLVGCGGPPKELQEKAAQLQKKALEVKADVYAKADYDAATAAVTKGLDAIKKSDWDGSKKAYTEGVAKFEAAIKAAPEGMKAATEEAKKAIADIKAAWEAYGKDKAAAAAVKKLKKDEAGKYAALKTEIETAVKEAEGMIEADPAGANAKAGEINAKFADLKAMTAPKTVKK